MSAQVENKKEPAYHELVRELNLACDADDLPRIRKLLATTSFNSRDITGAFDESQSVHVLRCLLEHGANADYIASSTRLRVLTLDHLKVTAEFGYDVKCRDHEILQDYAHSQEILDWILDQGVDINNSNHKRVEYTGASGGCCEDYSVKVLSNVAARGDIELFDHLVGRGADPHRSMALHSVCRCKDPQKAKAMVDHLLDKHGMNIEAHNKSLRKLMFMRDSGTPVHCAVHYNNLATLEQLLARGADPESGVKYAIGNFLFTSYLPALAPLLEAGENADRALDRAVGSKSVEAARICLAHGADLSRVVEEQQARAIRVQARREALLNDTWENDGPDEDSYSSDEGEYWRNNRTAMNEFLHSAERTRQRASED